MMNRRSAIWSLASFPSALAIATRLPSNSLFAIDEKEIISSFDSVRYSPKGFASGVKIPHHLFASRLIALGLWQAAGRVVSRIILIGPDHFGAAVAPASLSRSSFMTSFGKIDIDTGAVDRLLRDRSLFATSDLFRNEHSILALLPFIKYIFAEASVIPVALSLADDEMTCNRIVRAIRPLISTETLVIQSTDFSHYLSHHDAQRRDQETLNILASTSPGKIFTLNQPAHLDSRAAQYVQLSLQQNLGAVTSVIANLNSAEIGGGSEWTTSYVVQAYSKDPTEVPARGFRRLFFGGDVLLGRGFTRLLENEVIRDEMIAKVLEITGGAPLVVNLEGIILDEVPVGSPSGAHIMVASQALPILNAMNVHAVVLANNHSLDFGVAALETTVSLLDAAGIRSLREGEILEVEGAQLAAFDLVSSRSDGTRPQPESTKFEVLEQTNSAPVFAFVHWGREYTNVMSNREWQWADLLRRYGVGCVIGCHSHRASPQLESVGRGFQQILFSLGNMVFDQTGEQTSGVLLEVRLFPQGTWFSRVIAIPNFYSRGLGRLRAIQPPTPAEEPEAKSPCCEEIV